MATKKPTAPNVTRVKAPAKPGKSVSKPVGAAKAPTMKPVSRKPAVTKPPTKKGK